MPESAARVLSGTVSTTADTVTLTDKVMQVTVYNTHGTNILWVKVGTSPTSAAAAVTAAGTAVAAADEVYRVPPTGQQGIKVYKNAGRNPVWVGLSVIGSAASTTYTVHGTPWWD